MTVAIILAGGVGSRSKNEIPKQYYSYGGKTILEYTMDKFEKHADIEQIVLVADMEKIKKHLPYNILKKYQKLIRVVTPGKNRRESVKNALHFLYQKVGKNSKILVHDSVRPFVSEITISKVIEGLNDNSCIYPVYPTVDTVVMKKMETM